MHAPFFPLLCASDIIISCDDAEYFPLSLQTTRLNRSRLANGWILKEKSMFPKIDHNIFDQKTTGTFCPKVFLLEHWNFRGFFFFALSNNADNLSEMATLIFASNTVMLAYRHWYCAQKVFKLSYTSRQETHSSKYGTFQLIIEEMLFAKSFDLHHSIMTELKKPAELILLAETWSFRLFKSRHLK